ncbi:hypothetical protein [Embleya scabrispora]|uniref:hypothetical protein n=1 Tax=Embleya scabrispora TaxID=159449 RepID=UPI0003651E77|nr:hypothetical protein [Embleya scabrispora]MYS80644.1 hypothetical protein [Streptomyces sp. SID5474]
MSGFHARPQPQFPDDEEPTPVFDALIDEWVAAGREPPWSFPSIQVDTAPEPSTRPSDAARPTPVPGPRTGGR